MHSTRGLVERAKGEIDHIATLTPTASYDGPSEDVEVTIKNSGKGTVYDDDDGDCPGCPDNIDPPPLGDPLVLDTDKDGFISTVALEDSNAYFDITGDGIREQVGWIDGNDGILVYDKNENGKIDGIDEVFGNFDESRFVLENMQNIFITDISMNNLCA